LRFFIIKTSFCQSWFQRGWTEENPMSGGMSLEGRLAAVLNCAPWAQPEGRWKGIGEKGLE
jgi:hypothetical protein